MFPDLLLGSDKGLAEIVASMLPCCRLYGFLGCELAKWETDSNHPYHDWIRTYSSEEYLVRKALPTLYSNFIA